MHAIAEMPCHEIVSLRDDNAALKDDNASLKDDKASLKDDKAALRNDNAELKNDNVELKNDNVELKRDNASLRDKVDAMTSELLSLTKNLSAAHDPFDHAQEASQPAMEYVEGLSLVASLTLKLPAVTLLTTLRPCPCHRTPITVVQGSAA